MVVDRGLHKTRQTQVVLDVDIEDALVVLPFLYSPMVEKNFDCLCVALSASDMQSVTAIGILKVNVYILLKEKFHDIELVLASCNQQGVPCKVIWQIAVGLCVFNKVVDQHIVSTGTTTGIQKGVVPALISLNFDIYEKIEVFFTQSLSGL